MTSLRRSQQPIGGSRLSADPGVSDDVRAELVSAALTSADADFDYDMGEDVANFIQLNYLTMTVFTGEPSPEEAQAAATMVARADAVIPVLEAVHALRVRRILIADHRYKLTAHNLRTAIYGPSADEDDVLAASFEEVRREPDVYRYCLANPVIYLDLVESDAETAWSVSSPEVLAAVLNDITDNEGEIAEPWTSVDVDRLLALASSASSLPVLEDAPKALWRSLAGAELFTTTLSNVETYRAAFGIDEPLAAHLSASTGIVIDDAPPADDPEVRENVAVALLNAVTLTTSTRVTLVQSMELSGPLAADVIAAESNDLFALLLRAGLVTDDEDSFAHFRTAGWDSIRPAIEASENISSFVTPALVDGMLSNLLSHPAAADKLSDVVIKNVDTFLPAEGDAENADALGALARLADRLSASLSPGLITRIAGAATADKKVVFRLLEIAVPPATAMDVANVFRLVGPPFDKIATAGAKFKVDEEYGGLLTILKSEKLVDVRKAPRKDWFNVKVLKDC